MALLVPRPISLERADPLLEAGMVRRIARHLERRCQRIDRLAKRPERLGPVGGGQQRHSRLGGDRLPGGSVGGGPIGGDEVTRHGTGQLILTERLEVPSRGQMTRPTVSL